VVGLHHLLDIFSTAVDYSCWAHRNGNMRHQSLALPGYVLVGLPVVYSSILILVK
jgi:hypothetical protein